MPIAARGALWFLDTRVTIQISSDSGDDGISVLENLAPRGDSPPLHIHHTEDEVFHVLEGEFRVRVGDQERQMRDGETLLAPESVPHTYRVESEHGRWLVIIAHADFDASSKRLAARPLRPGCRSHPDRHRRTRPRPSLPLRGGTTSSSSVHRSTDRRRSRASTRGWLPGAYQR